MAEEDRRNNDETLRKARVSPFRCNTPTVRMRRRHCIGTRQLTAAYFGMYCCVLRRSFRAAEPAISAVGVVASAPSPFGWNGRRPRRPLPEASSTLLKTHGVYARFPPHDLSLYDLLQVPPNATAAEIAKSYRKITRTLHPDKHARNGKNDDGENDDDDAIRRRDELDRVREAYEVLRDDATRLPYHRHGLFETSQAAVLLTGGRYGFGGGGTSRGRSTSTNGEGRSEALLELLLLMGYEPTAPDARFRIGEEQRHRYRVHLLASRLAEKIRPVVEMGALTHGDLAHAVAEEADRLKALPLGAQIVRCVGRAYRHSGQKYLRKQRAKGRNRGMVDAIVGKQYGIMGTSKHLIGLEPLRERYRSAKHFVTAAVASGRVVLTETLLARRHGSSVEKQDLSLTYHFDDDEFGVVGTVSCGKGNRDDSHDPVMTDEEIKERERIKAELAALESMQVDALWKIFKIDLDRTVREACELVLEGDSFCFPSNQHPSQYDQHCRRRGEDDGWVGSSGVAIDADVGRIRAASALVMIGDIMVRRSKEGTAWID